MSVYISIFVWLHLQRCKMLLAEKKQLQLHLSGLFCRYLHQHIWLLSVFRGMCLRWRIWRHWLQCESDLPARSEDCDAWTDLWCWLPNLWHTHDCWGTIRQHQWPCLSFWRNWGRLTLWSQSLYLSVLNLTVLQQNCFCLICLFSASSPCFKAMHVLYASNIMVVLCKIDAFWCFDMLAFFFPN